MENITFDDMKPIENISVTDHLFEITNDFIVAGMSGNGGFNYAQLKLLGVETPPKTGWKERIIGTKIPRETARKYLAMKGKTKSVVRKEKINAIQNDLFSESKPGTKDSANSAGLKLEFNEANLLYNLLKKQIEVIQNTDMDEANKNYILHDYEKLLRKLEQTKNNASEYDET